MDTVSTKANAPAVQAAPIAPAISQAPQVYAAINAVQRDIAIVGIRKSNTTTGGAKFNFRGIDDVYNALSPIMAKHGLIVAPRYSDRAFVERKSSNGNSLFYITVTGHFDFISTNDGSKHTVTTFGEAMDSGDKGTNKAMAIAHKYALLQVFAIPTEGDNDPDNYTQKPQPYQGDNNNQQQQGNNNQQQQGQYGNQTHVGQAQRMTTPPLRVAPIEYIAITDANGKPKTSDGRRVFSAQQFQDLEQAILGGQYPAGLFMNSEKYYYSEAQFNALNQLASNNQPAIGNNNATNY